LRANEGLIPGVIRILVADDHAIVREGLKRTLSQEADFSVVAEAATGPETVDLARRAQPDVVVLDISMPGRGGIETVQEIKRLVPGARILMLSAHAEDHFAIRCLREGADGYLTKDTALELLVEAVRKIQGGRKYISASLAEQLAQNVDASFEPPSYERLSTREFEILRLIAVGRTLGEIAMELNLSLKTVSTYRSRILEKLDMKNNAELMVYALHQGLDG
jgi:two-component system, NarL family, invasion response regulator UvrY